MKITHITIDKQGRVKSIEGWINNQHIYVSAEGCYKNGKRTNA